MHCNVIFPKTYKWGGWPVCVLWPKNHISHISLEDIYGSVVHRLQIRFAKLQTFVIPWLTKISRHDRATQIVKTKSALRKNWGQQRGPPKILKNISNIPRAVWGIVSVSVGSNKIFCKKPNIYQIRARVIWLKAPTCILAEGPWLNTGPTLRRPYVH